jgi:hypothetical protein
VHGVLDIHSAKPGGTVFHATAFDMSDALKVGAWKMGVSQSASSTVACNSEQETQPKEEYIMVIDADSILRMPFIPAQLNVKRGALHIHSPRFGFLGDAI